MIPERKKKSVTFDLGDNGHNEAKSKLVEIFMRPSEDQLLMTSILNNNEIYRIAEARTIGRLLDESRYIYDENDNLVKHISLADVYINDLLKLKMSQNGKNREYLTWLTEGEQYSSADDDINSLRKI